MGKVEASREIMWNVSAIENSIVMYLLFGISLVIAAAGVFRHFELIASGAPSPSNLGNWAVRVKDLFTWGAMQRGVSREKEPGLFHLLIYLGFLMLTFATTMVFLEHDLGIMIYRGDFYLFVTLFSDVLGFGLLVGLGLAAHRRYIKNADLVHNKKADSLILIILALLVAQGFILEGLRIHATNDPWAAWSPVGLAVAMFFWPLSPDAATALHFIVWWFHAVTVFATLAITPYTKFFHIIASPVNLFFRYSGRPRGKLPFPGDLEKMMETAGDDFKIGRDSILDYSWKELLDLDACTSCGRCQDVCPAYNSGKPLSPKWLILDTRNHLLSLGANGKVAPSKLPNSLRKIDQGLMKNHFLPKNGLESVGSGYESKGKFRGANPRVQESAKSLGASASDSIAGVVIDPDVFWSCTTCYACVEACPVGINHVDQIVQNRRNMVLMRGEIPSEAQGTLRALEGRGNPYGPPEERTKWLSGLDVRILKPGDSVSYLYWVGCVSSYDPRKQKIARSLVTLMKAAGLDFGILGTSEGCTGDPARRLGEENLFQTLAKSNIEVLKGIRFETLVANCPHCFNTIKNEYPDFGNLGDERSPEIIHHSALLKRLLDEGKLNVGDVMERVTFHDPCYLGRYNGEYDAPRESLGKIKSLQIVEMERSKEKGLCCGAGGGHFWMDLKIGERVNTIRTEQAAATGASKVATACPFCMQMMEDGVKLTNREGSLEVKDIAEILAENLR